MARADRPDPVEAILAQWRRERPDVDVSPLAVFGRLHRSFLRYQDRISEVFDRYGITMAAFDVLAALRRSGPPYRRTAGELAEITLVTSGGLTLRIDRLEAAGLVVRERDPADRRVVHARLTKEGLALVDEVVEAHFANEREMLAGLTEPERRRLSALLAKLERSLDQAARAVP
ncbi:MarR family winged helix-turn-helix transcriptional regulator [Bailinhaonella thermotolerans]|uniref:MarR family transcriptional regulator n=1 Tax=Bailinhaonella thermotolerans TaxID=1070861 RepID=A0A3A4ACB0_9ACTN|nr:MarR family transcriptional regulator [Bailinhaonella thermotolerans]RJL24417.1 MarR family transcriptional regulator [Bailinhaonella thermotolerans]